MEFLGEEDYRAAMDGPCRAWREQCVKQESFTSYDGTKINYYFAIPEHASAVIVLFHGFCEFYGKYHEMTWYFYQHGFGFFFPEMRGHGLSGGKLKEKDLVHIDDYDSYVSDMKQFYDQVVAKIPLPKLLFAHSMGGAIAALYLENYTSDYQGAVLSSPMLKLRTNGYSPRKIKMLAFFATLFHMKKKLSAGQSRFDGVNIFEKSSCQSRARYDYMFEMRCADENYQTYGSTYGWSIASLKATDKLIANASKIRTPLAVFMAGQDHLVDPEGYTQLFQALPDTHRYAYPSSRHEIFNATTDVRKDYYKKLFHELDTMTEEVG
ncbi:MAG: alpha/beta fold hydrolase [Bilifractor sp.]